MNIRFFIAIIVFNVPLYAGAYCIGGAGFSNCYDSSGNSYSVSRFGPTTSVQGFNSSTGSSWNETVNRFGNVTSIDGTAANGASWNETITNLGGGNYTESGINSRGEFFSRVCTPYGCN